MSRTSRTTSSGIFDRGNYSMGSLPSRHIMEKEISVQKTGLKERKQMDEEKEIETLKKKLNQSSTNNKKQQRIITDKNSNTTQDNTAQEEDNVDNEDDNDEEEVLLRKEVEKIKQERAEVKRLRMASTKAASTGAMIAETMSNAVNPLLPDLIDSSTSIQPQPKRSSTTKTWDDDDIVFQSSSKKTKSNTTNRFINDTTKSDTHRSFLQNIIR
jgi:hypothetical protein